jgi:DNA-binding NtrC family response regulator
MNRQKILIVDQDVTFRNRAQAFFKEHRIEVDCVKNPEEGLAIYPHQPYSIVISDFSLALDSVIQFHDQLKELNRPLIHIAVSSRPSIDQAVSATKAGLDYYFGKPLDFEQIKEILFEEASVTFKEKPSKKASIKELSEPIEGTALSGALNGALKEIIGQSSAIQEVLNTVEKVADSDSTILITGESGTGKELIARAIHQMSSRGDEALIPVNCGAIPDDLLESELFGHVKGAFTGAISNRIGRFEAADGGTIFLDEIGDMPPSLQVKVLRVIQSCCFEPVGSTKTVEVDARIIAATNVDLENAVQEKKFREDLFYRLNVIPFSIPPLRQRRSDIPVLAKTFLDRFNAQKKKNVHSISQQAMDCLMAYHWPGNVRELENLIERIVILKSKGCIEVEDLPVKFFENMPESFESDDKESGQISRKSFWPGMTLPEDGLDFKEVVNHIEKDLMIQALDRTGWNKNKASELLKMNRTTLVEKLKKKGIRNPSA